LGTTQGPDLVLDPTGMQDEPPGVHQALLLAGNGFDAASFDAVTPSPAARVLPDRGKESCGRKPHGRPDSGHLTIIGIGSNLWICQMGLTYVCGFA
jgi:hypothetical protein